MPLSGEGCYPAGVSPRCCWAVVQALWEAVSTDLASHAGADAPSKLVASRLPRPFGLARESGGRPGRASPARTVVPHGRDHEGSGAAAGPRSIRAGRTTTGTSGHPNRSSALPRTGRSIAQSSLRTTRSSASSRAPCGRLPTRQVPAADAAAPDPAPLGPAGGGERSPAVTHGQGKHPLSCGFARRPWTTP
jgi:hypothetical protein